MDTPLVLPSGESIDGSTPVVVVGPNGSGKTRQTRNIQSSPPPEFVNALRNTRVAPELPAMGVDTARANYENQKAQSRGAFWELASEFDFMLSQLLAQYSTAAIEFSERVQLHPETLADGPTVTPLKRIGELWAEVFPGRSLAWVDWKPVVTSASGGATVKYSGNQMSDGEKSALFLAGRVFSSPPGVLVVDEPETHFHSLLAVRLWNALEDARPDIRFVYVTHDLTFALSRREATFVLASPTQGLRIVEFARELPDDVAGALLGSASLSFYASRVVFCEGEEGSYDAALYGSWFNGPDTVVRPVGGCQAVLRCVQALRNSGIANSLEAIGIIDRDYHAQAFLDALPPGIHILPTHEIEALLALPAIVELVAAHLGQDFDQAVYGDLLKASVSGSQEHSVIIQRWKAAVEPNLGGLVADTSGRQTTIAQLTADLPAIFDPVNWRFDPAAMLIQEQGRVQGALADGGSADFMKIVPGKQLLPLAARSCGMEKPAYVDLIVKALRATREPLAPLGASLAAVLSAYLPTRAVATQMPIQPLTP